MEIKWRQERGGKAEMRVLSQPNPQAKLLERCQRCAWERRMQRQVEKNTQIYRSKIDSLSGKWVCFETNVQWCKKKKKRKKYVTLTELLRHYHTERKGEESRLSVAPVKTNIQINCFSGDWVEVFEISHPQQQLVSSPIYSQGGMSDGKRGRQQTENQPCSDRPRDFLRSFHPLLASGKSRQWPLEHRKESSGCSQQVCSC